MMMSRLLLLLCCFFLALHSASGQLYAAPSCPLNKDPVVLLSRNPKTGHFTLLKRFSSDFSDFDSVPDFRLLQEDNYLQDSSGDRSLRRGSFPGLTLEDVPKSSRSLEQEDLDNQNVTGELFYARECNCFTVTSPVKNYCPFAVKHCRQGPVDVWNPDAPALCLTHPKGYEGTITIFLTIVIFYVMIGINIVCTTAGRTCVSFLFSWIPGWNRYMADRMLRNDRPRARLLILNNLAWRRRMLEHNNRSIFIGWASATGSQQAEGTPGTQQANNASRDTAAANYAQEPEMLQPTSLALRTRIYKKDSLRKRRNSNHNKEDDNARTLSLSCSIAESDDEDDEDANCTICFAPLLDGDRVGSLPCNHVFHAECLKSWVQRRNVCPLCQAQNIATSRYDDEEATEVSSALSLTNPSSYADTLDDAST
jgi:hypothetical protein